MDIGKRLWYVWLIIALVAAAGIGFAVYWFVFRAKNDSDSGNTPSDSGLTQPDFTLLFELGVEGGGTVINQSYVPATGQGFVTILVAGQTSGNFFTLDVDSASFTFTGEPIPNIRENVMLDNLAVLYDLDTSKAWSTYTYSDGTNWAKTTDGTDIKNAIPFKLWKNGNTTYCICISAADNVKTKSILVYSFSNSDWTQVFTYTDSISLLAVDVADKSGTLVFIDVDFNVKTIDMLEDKSSWKSETQDAGSAWDNVSNDPISKNLASLSVQADGSRMSVSLNRGDVGAAGTFSTQSGIFDLSSKQMTEDSTITEKTAQIANTSALADFKMLSYVTNIEVDVFRTDTSDDYSLVTGKKGLLKGDPAQFNNANSTGALVTYHNDSTILLMCGGASEDITISFYVMKI